MGSVGRNVSTQRFVAKVSVYTPGPTKSIVEVVATSARKGMYAYMGCAAMLKVKDEKPTSNQSGSTSCAAS